MKIFLNNGFISIDDKKIEYGDIRELEKRLKNKLLDIIILDEKIYIDYIKIPKCRVKYIDNIVKNHTEDKFKTMETVLYNYVIVKKERGEMHILIYYIYSNKVNNLMTLNGKIKIKSLYPIQMIFLSTIRKIIKKNTCNLVFGYYGYIYIVSYYKGYILSSSVISEGNEDVERYCKKVLEVLEMAKNIALKINIDIDRNIYFYINNEKIKESDIENLNNNFKEILGEMHYDVQI